MTSYFNSLFFIDIRILSVVYEAKVLEQGFLSIWKEINSYYEITRKFKKILKLYKKYILKNNYYNAYNKSFEF